MAKRKTPVEKGIEGLILRTVKDAKEAPRAPGADKLLAIARLLNSYARLKGGGSVTRGRAKSYEEMTDEEKERYHLEFGNPDYYTKMSKPTAF